jgi:uncharacterized ferritin-like protein (DUF455 family)
VKPATRGVFRLAADAFALPDPLQKCEATEALWARVEAGDFEWDRQTPAPPVNQPGRPELPQLVAPGQVPRRRLGSAEGRSALLHAIAHIEFNAINLALDAACRFRDMPEDYTLDWISVAADEARHFRLLDQRLRETGYSYGDFPAHNGLWEMAEKTALSCLERMALVPRVLEARGLDVTPGMIRRLTGVGDHPSVSILEVILSEEVRHVEIGSRWFRHCCEEANVEPESTFLDLLQTHFTGSLRGPFNLDARLKAGFSNAEMEAIASIGS